MELKVGFWTLDRITNKRPRQKEHGCLSFWYLSSLLLGEGRGGCVSDEGHFCCSETTSKFCLWERSCMVKQKCHFHLLRELFAPKTHKCSNRRITEKKLIQNYGSLGDTETLCWETSQRLTPHHDPLRPWYPRYKYTKDTALKPLNGCLIKGDWAHLCQTCLIGVGCQDTGVPRRAVVSQLNKNRAKETCEHLTNSRGDGDYTEENLKIGAGKTNNSISHGNMLK